MAEAAVIDDVGTRRSVSSQEMGGVQNNPPPAPASGGQPEIESDRIVKHIMCKLTAFDAAVKKNKLLEIDGVAINGEACDEVTQESKIKVLNSHNEAAYEVSVDAIVRQPLQDLILALETGLFMWLHGVTRIVGYFSRINNWNASKIGELHDRHKGDYGVGVNGSGCKPEPA